MKFINTFGSGATATFQNEVVAAENYLKSHFTNACTVNCKFDLQSINPAFSGENFFNPITVSYSTFVNALQSHATTAAAKQAATAMAALADPSNGAGFDISIGEARILGLAGAGSGIDDTVILNSVYWTPSALQNNPGDAKAVIMHELTEGIMGRIGSLGFSFGGHWAPMDLLRFNAAGQRDFTGGQDGQPTYFSTNGNHVNTGLQYHNSVNGSGHFDGFDLADWNSVGADANNHDPFGPGGHGSGDPGKLSVTDITLLEALGWTPPPKPAVGGINQTVADNQSVAMSSIFSVQGMAISKYHVWFADGAVDGYPALGSLTNNGTPIAQNQLVTLSSLAGVVYTGSATAGTDKIWLQVYNGTWSGWAEADLTDQGGGMAGTAPGKLDQTVSLLNQYMASSFGRSDFGSAVNPVADPLATPSGETAFLAQPAQGHLR
jgi:hypothetical protein